MDKCKCGKIKKSTFKMCFNCNQQQQSKSISCQNDYNKCQCGKNKKMSFKKCFICTQKQKLFSNMFKYPYLFRKLNDSDNFKLGIMYIDSLAHYSTVLSNYLKLNDKTTTYIYNKMVLNRIINSSDIKNFIMGFIYTDLDRF